MLDPRDIIQQILSLYLVVTEHIKSLTFNVYQSKRTLEKLVAIIKGMKIMLHEVKPVKLSLFFCITEFDGFLPNSW